MTTASLKNGGLVTGKKSDDENMILIEEAEPKELKEKTVSNSTVVDNIGFCTVFFSLRRRKLLDYLLL